MALGIETILALVAAVAIQSVEVRHEHALRDGPGTLSATAEGITFTETGKRPKHSRAWRWQDIQQLELRPDKLRILTYEDQKLQAGRDREYVFLGLTAETSAALHPVFREHLDARYVAGVPDPVSAPVWQIAAKLQERLGGSEGRLTFAGDRLVYDSAERGATRSWRIEDVESISTADRYELTVSTLERSGWTRGRRDFRFQLKEPLAEPQYQALWVAVNRARGLATWGTEGHVHPSMKEKQQ